jgi:hypothetical protein
MMLRFCDSTKLRGRSDGILVVRLRDGVVLLLHGDKVEGFKTGRASSTMQENKLIGSRILGLLRDGDVDDWHRQDISHGEFPFDF